MRSAGALVATLLIAGAAAPARAPAQAGSLPPYGGGALTPAAPLVGLRALPGSGQVAVDGEAIARCNVRLSINERLRVRAPLRAGGAFRGFATRTYKVSPSETRSVRLTVDGRLSDPTRAAGGLRLVTLVRRTGQPVVRCDSGRQAWQARSVRAGAQPPGPVRSGAPLFGSTFQGGRFIPYPLAMRVSPAGTSVQSTIFRVYRRCRGARSDDIANNLAPAPVAADGSFAVTQRYTERFSDAAEEFTFALQGRFTTAGAQGTLHATSLVRDLKTRRVLGRCDSGRVGWAAIP